jgi:phosphate transport system substrate-binding protein
MLRTIIVVVAVALVVTATAAARSLGTISADGSSTVGPYVTAAAEAFQKRNSNTRITVGISGTGGGFERFCRGETDLQNASRPIRLSEHQRCLQNGVRWVAFNVANDGIAIVVNRENTWANCLTTDELKRMWDTGSKIDNWRDIRPQFPNVPLKLFGPGTDSGTFDFFTEKINGRSRRSRSDYLATENDNVVVQGVAGERGGLGYFGLSYYLENKDRLKLVSVNSGAGCVAPSIATVQSFKYRPLSRPLFVYAKRESFRRREVQRFINFMLQNQLSIAKRSDFVPLTRKQSAKARFAFKQALKKLQ